MQKFLWQIKNRVHRWLGIDPSYIELKIDDEPASTTFIYHQPDPAAVKRRHRLMAFATNQWTVSVGAALFAVIAAKLLDPR
jgi:hypothetical protein